MMAHLRMKIGVLAAAVLLAPPAFALQKRGIRVVPAAGQRYVALKTLASFYGMDLESASSSAALRGNGVRLDFQTDSRRALINGTQAWLSAPMRRVWGGWAIAEGDARRVVDPLLRPQRALAGQGARIVVLDPGHGGKDRGARGPRGLEEMVVTLDIARRVRTLLAGAGYKVSLTRESDQYISLEDRAERARQLRAHVFVSIHLNSADSASADGPETYVLAAPGSPSTASDSSAPPERTVYPGNQHDGANMILGYYLQQSIVKATANEDRGIRQARFVVLKRAPCPAALVECTFVSQRGEEQRLRAGAYRQTIAEGIARGLAGYLVAVQQSQAVPATTP